MLFKYVTDERIGVRLKKREEVSSEVRTYSVTLPPFVHEVRSLYNKVETRFHSEVVHSECLSGDREVRTAWYDKIRPAEVINRTV